MWLKGESFKKRFVFVTFPRKKDWELLYLKKILPREEQSVVV